MARQRRLTVPVEVSINGTVVDSFDTVRICSFNCDVAQKFENQRIMFLWAIGKVVDGVFQESQYPGMRGCKHYDNYAPTYSFGNLLQRSFVGESMGIGLMLDSVFSDIESDGLIGAGTQEDYGLAPGS